MKPVFIGLLFVAASGPAFAQVATPILPPDVPGPPPTGTFTMSGCVSGPAAGTGLITMLGPAISPSSAIPESYLASSAPPPRAEPIIVSPPAYEPPLLDQFAPAPETPLEYEDVGAVGTAGAEGMLGPPPGPVGYRLSGHDMSAWVGRRVQAIGTMDLVPPQFIPGTVDTSNPATFQEFHVVSVVPLTDACPQR